MQSTSSSRTECCGEVQQVTLPCTTDLWDCSGARCVPCAGANSPASWSAGLSFLAARENGWYVICTRCAPEGLPSSQPPTAIPSSPNRQGITTYSPVSPLLVV
jgi:hypothetical protein